MAHLHDKRLYAKVGLSWPGVEQPCWGMKDQLAFLRILCTPGNGDRSCYLVPCVASWLAPTLACSGNLITPSCSIMEARFQFAYPSAILLPSSR